MRATLLAAVLLTACATDDAAAPDAAITVDNAAAEEWATTHCERRWVDCALPSNNRDHYVLSCVTVAMSFVCEEKARDGVGYFDCPPPVKPLEPCLDEMIAATCDELGPMPSCNPWVLE